MFTYLNLYPGYLCFVGCFKKIMLSTNKTELSVKVSVMCSVTMFSIQSLEILLSFLLK